MKKPAPAVHPIHELIRHRWSPHAFSSQPVSRQDLLTVLEAARWAPSCYNDQPWSFLVGIQGDDTWQGIRDCLVEGNRVWAAQAPVLMVSLAHERFVRNGKPNRHAQHDVGQAALALSLQATELGLFVHQMGGFDAEALRKRFSIPPDHTPMAAIALGHAGESETLPEHLAQREHAERERVPLEVFTFSGAWGQTAPFVADPPEAQP